MSSLLTMTEEQLYMQNLTKSQKQLIEHFDYVGSDVPFADTPEAPFSGIITGWFKYLDVFLAKTDVVQTDYFYCPIHRRWLKLRDNTFYFIERHLSTHTGYGQLFRRSKSKAIDAIIDSTTKIKFTKQQQQYLQENILKYLLLTDKPLSDGDNAFIQAIIPSINATGLRNRAGEIADSVRLEIKAIIQNVDYIRPSIDEWSDAMNNRYVGETIYTIYKGEWQCFVVALRKINGLHATSAEIANILTSIENDYEIALNKERFCSDNCNTMKGVANKKELYRFPCIIHFLHNVAKQYLKTETEWTVELKKFVKKLHKSSVFAGYCDSHHIQRIPTFTEVRWASISNTLIYLDTNKNHIQMYLNENKIDDMNQEFWDLVHESKTFFRTIYLCIELLEGDEFGTISYVNQVIERLKKAISSIVEEPEKRDRLLGYIAQFLQDYKEEMFPLIYIAEFCNPQICLSLNDTQIIDVKRHIAIKAAELGFPIPNPNERQRSRSDEEIISFTDCSDERVTLLDELEDPKLRKMGRDESLLSFWLSKLNNPETKGIAKVALDTLSTLCNSASVEREFSKAKNILTMKRLRLLPVITEDLLIISANKKISEKYITYEL